MNLAKRSWRHIHHGAIFVSGQGIDVRHFSQNLISTPQYTYSGEIFKS